MFMQIPVNPISSLWYTILFKLFFYHVLKRARASEIMTTHLFAQQFAPAKSKESIKACHHWPHVKDGYPSQMASNVECISCHDVIKETALQVT